MHGSHADTTATSRTDSPPVTLERAAPHVALVTLHRPQAANAIDVAATAGLRDAVRATEEDRQVRVVVLRSGHPRVFCAGADLPTIAAGRTRELFPEDGGFAGFVRARRSKPWIAVVDGAAVAGGLEIAVACDLLLCSPAARFSLPEVSRGLAPLAGGLQRLPGRIPTAAAMDMIVTGEPVDGTRAWQLGLASRIAPSADLIALALATAAAIASNAPGAVQDSLRMARLALARGEEAAWNATPQVEAERLRSSEVDEGIRAFREKRPPSWQGT